MGECIGTHDTAAERARVARCMAVPAGRRPRTADAEARRWYLTAGCAADVDGWIAAEATFGSYGPRIGPFARNAARFARAARKVRADAAGAVAVDIAAARMAERPRPVRGMTAVWRVIAGAAIGAAILAGCGADPAPAPSADPMRAAIARAEAAEARADRAEAAMHAAAEAAMQAGPGEWRPFGPGGPVVMAELYAADPAEAAEDATVAAVILTYGPDGPMGEDDTPYGILTADARGAWRADIDCGP